MSQAPKPPAASGVMRKPLEVPAGELLPRCKLGEEALARLQSTTSAGAVVEEFFAAGLHVDAIRLMAAALPRRESVWWACACLREVAAPSDPPTEKAVLDAAVRWVSAPNEENRRAAYAAAESVNFEPLAANAALAAYWSGGSISLPKLPEVPPPPHLLATAVTNAIALAGLKPDPAKAAEKYAAFLASARALAEGKSRLPEPVPTVPAKPIPGKR